MCITCKFPSCSWKKSKGHVGCLAKHCIQEHSKGICVSKLETFQILFRDIKKSNVFLLIHKTHNEQYELYWLFINIGHDGFFLSICSVHTAPKRLYEISIACHRFGVNHSNRLVVKEMPKNKSDLTYSLKISRFLTDEMCSSAMLEVRFFDEIFATPPNSDIATSVCSKMDISRNKRLQTRRCSTTAECQTPDDNCELDRLADADRTLSESSTNKEDIEISEPCIVCQGFQTRNFLKACGNAHFICRLCFSEQPSPKKCLVCKMDMDENEDGSDLSESVVETQIDFEYYRCSVCTDFIKSKARYCLRGHLVCNLCFCKMLEYQYNICPICKNKYPDDNICAEIEETLKTLNFPEE